MNSKKIKLVVICVITMYMAACSSSYKEEVSRNQKINKEIYLENKNLEGLSVDQIIEILKNYSKETDVEPKNARFDKEKWSIEPEKNGKKVNIDKTIDLIMHSSAGEKLTPIVEDVKPDITSDTLRKNMTEIGSFSTKVLDDQNSRVKNLKLAGDYIDDIQILPQEEFSFNGTLGKRTKEKGYKKAPIIINTKKGPKKSYGVGGGICQISSTLYNAALEAGLDITERHPHSKDVGYIKKGQDATVVYGGADLKFINNRDNPIIIKVTVTNEEVVVKLFEVKDRGLL